MYSHSSTINAKRTILHRLFQAGSRMIVGLLLAFPVFLSSCAFLPSGPLPQEPNGPPRAMIDGVPFFPQDEFQCGPAALAMVLNWSGLAVQPSDLTPEVYSPELKGSLQSSLIGSSRRHGRVAYPIAGSEALLAELSAGHPVVVLVNLSFNWYPKWHYAVVIGYDQHAGAVILNSGLTAGEILSSRIFMNIWKRSEFWGLLVLPPDQLPANVEELSWLTAVAGLEKTGQWQAAETGYATALKRWHDSFIAWMGLGNSRYRLHDLAGAAEAFHQATRRQPDNGMAFNNLAQVLSEQGLRKEAMVAAQRAVELDGPFIDTFRQTLTEIRQKQ